MRTADKDGKLSLTPPYTSPSSSSGQRMASGPPMPKVPPLAMPKLPNNQTGSSTKVSAAKAPNTLPAAPNLPLPKIPKTSAVSGPAIKKSGVIIGGYPRQSLLAQAVRNDSVGNNYQANSRSDYLVPAAAASSRPVGSGNHVTENQSVTSVNKNIQAPGRGSGSSQDSASSSTAVVSVVTTTDNTTITCTDNQSFSLDPEKVDSSQVDNTAASSQRMMLIIDFDNLFYKGDVPCSVRDIAIVLAELLKLFEITFLTSNVEKAKNLLCEHYEYAMNYFIGRDAKDVKFLFCKSLEEKLRHVSSYLLRHRLKRSGSKIQTTEGLMLVIFHRFGNLGDVNVKTCRLLAIDQTSNITDKVGNHVEVLKQLYRECTPLQKNRDEEERNSKITRIQSEAAKIINDPQFIQLKRDVTYTKFELEMVGDLAYVVEREKDIIEFRKIFNRVLPENLNVVPLYASAYVYESFCRCLKSLDKDAYFTVEIIKQYMLQYIQALDVESGNWVKSILSGKDDERYEKYLAFLKLSRDKLESEIDKGRANYRGPCQEDVLAVDFRIICSIYNVKIHIARLTESKIEHVLVTKEGMQQLDVERSRRKIGSTIKYELADVYSIPRCLHICTYAKLDKYECTELFFMPVLPRGEVQANLDIPIPKTTYNEQQFEQLVMTKCNADLRKDILNADPTFKHFLFILYSLYDNELVKYATQQQNANIPNLTGRKSSVESLAQSLASGSTSNSASQIHLVGKGSPKYTGSPGSRSRRESIDNYQLNNTGRASPLSLTDRGPTVSEVLNAMTAGKSPRATADSAATQNSPTVLVGRLRQASIDQSSGRSSPRTPGKSGQSSPRTLDSIGNDKLIVASTSPRSSGSPFCRTPSIASNSAAKIPLVSQEEFVNYIRDFLAIFKNETNNFSADYQQFMRQFFLILAYTLTKKVNMCLDQYHEDLKEKKEFATCDNQKYIWASKEDQKALRMELFNFLVTFRTQLYLWLQTINDKVFKSNFVGDVLKANKVGCLLNTDNIGDFLEYLLTLLLNSRINLSAKFETIHEDYHERTEQYDAKLNELPQERYTLALSKFFTSSFIPVSSEGDIFTLCKNGQFAAFVKGLDAEQRAGFGAAKFDINAPSKYRGKYGNNLLQIACGEGREDIVQELIKRKADVNYRRDNNTDSPSLFYIIKHLNTNATGNVIISLLLGAGAETVVFDPNGRTPLHTAEKIPTERILEYLTQQPGKQIEALFTKSKMHASRPNEPTCSSLCHALHKSKIDVVDVYYSHGRILTIDEINELILGNKLDVINPLITLLKKKVDEYKFRMERYEKDARSKDPTKERTSPIKTLSSKRGELHLSARARAMIEENHNAEVKSEENELMQKLGIERANQRTPSVKNLLSLMFGSSSSSSNDTTMKTSRSSTNLPPVLLVQDNKSLSSSTNHQQSPGRSEITQALSQRSHRAETLGTQTVSPSSMSERSAIKSPRPISDAGPVILQRDVILSPKGSSQVEGEIHKDIIMEDFNLLSDKTGLAPIHIACILGNKPLFTKLLQMNVNLSVCSAEGFTPLYYTVLHGHKDLVDQLIDAQAPLLPLANDLNDLLQKEELKFRLIREKARENQERNCLIQKRKMAGMSRTPLHAAAERCDADLFKRIYKYAIETRCYECIYRRDDENYTPLTRAVVLLNKEIMEYCRDRGFWLNKRFDEDGIITFKIWDPFLLKEIFSLMKEVFEKQLKQLEDSLAKTPGKEAQPKSPNVSPRSRAFSSYQ